MINVYCFGNEYLEFDSLAKNIVNDIKIPDINFIKCNSPDDLVLEERQINILDVASGIDDIIVIEDLDYLNDNRISSLHDFDLQFFLKLMKETGQIKKVKIVCIPLKYDKIEAIKKLNAIFSAFSN